MKSGILILEQVRTGRKDQLTFRLTDEAFTKQKAYRFFLEHMRREQKAEKPFQIEAEFEVHYQKRTLSQNRLLRSLERVMSQEQYGVDDQIDEFHEGLIELYCPYQDHVNPITGRKQKKRTSELNTMEMSQVIGGAFFELANMGVELSSGNIANYWIEWYNWRGRQSHDPFTAKARTIEQYKHDVPLCEACMKGLRTTDNYGKDIYVGQIAHIVSRGSGGTDDLWNLMHLCTDCHIHLQHQKGWLHLLARYSHIAFRVADAQIKSGRVPVIEKDSDWEAVLKEVRRIEKHRQEELGDFAESALRVFGGEAEGAQTQKEEIEIF